MGIEPEVRIRPGPILGFFDKYMMVTGLKGDLDGKKLVVTILVSVESCKFPFNLLLISKNPCYTSHPT